MTTCSIGIDTGGTFTDVVLVDNARGRTTTTKVPSNPADPAEAILRGLDEILAMTGTPGDRVGFIGLGTTLATNAVLQNRLGRAALVTTAGFADVLELARQRRPHLYDLDAPVPRVPVARGDRIEVAERIDAAGMVVTPFDAAAFRRELARLDGGVEAIAVCLLHAYRTPVHEHAVREIVAAMLPDVPVSLSSDINPEFREYERFATTAMNAALLPVMARYLAQFASGVAARGVTVAPVVIQSNGGLVSPQTLARRPIDTFFSGPAGGVVGALRVAEAAGIGDLVTLDIGGTSTDVCLIRDGRAARTMVRDMAGLPVRVPSIDLHTIGAGGGSIAAVDAGGLPTVGPESAGARPGPACYGLGGVRPTVTDANVVLGRLDPKFLLGGRMEIDAAKAEAAIATGVATPLGIGVQEAAAGILEIATVNIAGAVRVISVERGEDPRGFALLAFGGGGPLHAAEVAESMGMRRVLVPRHPGITCAIGLLGAERRADFGITCLAAPDQAEVAVTAAFGALRDRAEAWRAGERLDDMQVETSLELRYRGQSSELSVPLAGRFDAARLADAVAAFHDLHEARFGYAMRARDVEIVTARLTACKALPGLPPEQASVRREGAPRRREAWFRATGFAPTPVLDRDTLDPAAVLHGPLIVEQMDTTTVVPPGWSLRVDGLGNLVLERV